MRATQIVQELLASFKAGDSVWYSKGGKHFMAKVDDYDTNDNIYLVTYRRLDPASGRQTNVTVVAAPGELSPNPQRGDGFEPPMNH